MDNDESGEKRVEYIVCVKDFENKIERGKRKLVGDSCKPLPLSWSNVIDEAGTEDRVNVGVFWTKEVWEQNEEALFPKKASKYKGQVGVWRGKEHGEPPGSITVAQLHTKKAQKVTQLAGPEHMADEVKELCGFKTKY